MSIFDLQLSFPLAQPILSSWSEKLSFPSNTPFPSTFISPTYVAYKNESGETVQV